MNTGTGYQTINFSYADPKAEAPAVIWLHYLGRIYDLINGSDPVRIDLPLEPDNFSEGLMTLEFNSAYYRLHLYYNEGSLCFALLDSGRNPEILFPFEFNINKDIVVYSSDPANQPGSAIIRADKNGDDPTIGVVIVGTSGLGERVPV